MVRFCGFGLGLILLVGHAPHTGYQPAEVSEWWTSFASSIPTKYDLWDRLCLVDANARVGNTPSTVISDYKAEEQDVNGDYFHDFVIQNRLWCPSTFERFHDGSSGTWQHPRSQTWHRCDFVCLPQSWDIDFCYSWVNDSIDLSLKRDDHRVACVRVVLTVLHQPEAWRHRTPRYNVEALSQDMRYNYYEVAKDLQENPPSGNMGNGCAYSPPQSPRCYAEMVAEMVPSAKEEPETEACVGGYMDCGSTKTTLPEKYRGHEESTSTNIRWHIGSNVGSVVVLWKNDLRSLWNPPFGQARE